MASLRNRIALPRCFPRLSSNHIRVNIAKRGMAVQYDRPGTTYVWKEPPGRLRKILDLQGFAEQRWKYIRRKFLEKLLETTRRARLSNDAWQTRLEKLEQQYQHLAYGLQQMLQLVERLCGNYGVSKPTETRRKFDFDRFDASVVDGPKYDPSYSSGRMDRPDDEEEEEEFVRPDTEADPTAPLLRPEALGKADRRQRRDERKKRK
jgi:hypothetical protein